MGMHPITPFASEFTIIASDAIVGVRPTGAYGVSVTPGNNTYGTYAQLFAAASVTDDVVGILININSVSVNATATDTIAKIGFDSSGGTTYTNDERIVDLMCSAASAYTGSAGAAGPGAWYFFPLWIKNGTTIGISLSQNNGAPAASRALAYLLTRPRNPHTWRTCSKVVTYGTTPASSTGTAVTAGGASDGAWTQLGTIGAAEKPWWWQAGFGVNNSAISTTVIHHMSLSIGQAGAKKTVIMNQVVDLDTSERVGSGPVLPPQGFGDGAPSELVYGKLWSSSSPQSGLSMAAYGAY